jgi:hypothetical protein
MVIEKRNIVTEVVLTIITCGIYSWFWSYKIWSSLYRATGKPDTAGTDVLLSLITCGIYYIYMMYKTGKLQDEAYVMNGLGQKDESLLFVILAVLSLSIVVNCIAQSNINEQLADAVNHKPIQ